MVVPATAKAIIEVIKTEHHYSIREIAQTLGVSLKALYNIQNDNPHSSSLHAKLMLLYVQIKVIEEFNQLRAKKHSENFKAKKNCKQTLNKHIRLSENL